MCKFYKKINNKQTKTKTKKLYQCSYLFFSFSLFLLLFFLNTFCKNNIFFYLQINFEEF